MSYRALAAAAVLLAAAAGCSEDADQRAPPSPAVDQTEKSRPAPLERARCPRGLTGCRTATGRIVYVERVDPDGDGDAHFVLLSREAITAPGLSVIDVEKSLRPSPLPRVGERISAAGPVYPGSYGQRQIEAVELHVAHR